MKTNEGWLTQSRRYDHLRIQIFMPVENERSKILSFSCVQRKTKYSESQYGERMIMRLRHIILDDLREYTASRSPAQGKRGRYFATPRFRNTCTTPFFGENADPESASYITTTSGRLSPLTSATVRS